MASTATNPVIKIKGGTFVEQGHVYTDDRGIRIPSVTQALAAVNLVDFSKINPAVLERKRLIGSAVHAACEFLMTPEKGELDWNTIPEPCVGYVIGLENMLEELEFRASAVEEQGICVVSGMAFGYRIDLRGTVGKGKHPAIGEIKCGCQVSPSWQLQTAAYEMASPKLDNGKTYLRFAAQLKPDAAFKVYAHDEKYDGRIFLSALSLTHFKLANKFSLPDVADDICEVEDVE